MKKIVFILLLTVLLTSCSQETENADSNKELPPLGNEVPNDANLREESLTPQEETEEQLPPIEEGEGNTILESTSNEKSIYTHSIYLAKSKDGETWSKETTAIAEHASMPELVYTKNNPTFNEGTILLYFVDASIQETGEENLALSISEDQGETWSERETLSIEGAENLIPVDPSVIEMEDGSLRLYYFDFTTGLTAPQNPNQDFVMYTALSTDGKTFTENEIAFSYDTYITDPEVIEFNGAWYMYFLFVDETTIGIAKSTDGIHFEYLTDLETTGVPGAQVVEEQIYLYGCKLGTNSGISLSKSSDGETYSEAEVIIQEHGICAPAGIQLADESLLLAVNQE